MIQFKLEGQAIMRNPSFCMEDRLLLDKIDYETQSITIGGVTYALEDCDFPTVDRNDPYRLTEEEQEIVSELKTSFAHSPRLQGAYGIPLPGGVDVPMLQRKPSLPRLSAHE